MKIRNKARQLALASVASLSLLQGGQAVASGPFADCAATPRATFDGTVVDAAIATPALSTLVDAVTAAGLVDALAETDNITVYAPTNDAFAALPAGVLDAVLADMDLLAEVLTYHVSTGRRDPRLHFTSVLRNTLQGQQVYYSAVNGHPTVNGANVTCQGVRTDNGIVWVIDRVLIPGF